MGIRIDGVERFHELRGPNLVFRVRTLVGAECEAEGKGLRGGGVVVLFDPDCNMLVGTGEICEPGMYDDQACHVDNTCYRHFDSPLGLRQRMINSPFSSLNSLEMLRSPLLMLNSWVLWYRDVLLCVLGCFGRARLCCFDNGTGAATWPIGFV